MLFRSLELHGSAILCLPLLVGSMQLERDQAIKPPSDVKHVYFETEMTEMVVEILWQS